MSQLWFTEQKWFALECAHRDILTHYFMIAKLNPKINVFGKTLLRYIVLINIVVTMRLARYTKRINTFTLYKYLPWLQLG